MKYAMLLLLFLMTSLTLTGQAKSFHDLSAADIDGIEVKMEVYKGKKILVVNVASKCGYTPQYEPLEALYKKYGPDKFVVLAFPANNFRSQEPGTNEEIKSFCSSTYHVTFPLMSKISVKGDDMSPVYQWLTQKSLNGVMDAPVTWNFQKFMIDENGKLVGMLEPDAEPNDPKVIQWLEKD